MDKKYEKLWDENSIDVPWYVPVPEFCKMLGLDPTKDKHIVYRYFKLGMPHKKIPPDSKRPRILVKVREAFDWIDKYCDATKDKDGDYVER